MEIYLLLVLLLQSLRRIYGVRFRVCDMSHVRSKYKRAEVWSTTMWVGLIQLEVWAPSLSEAVQTFPV